MELMSKLKGLVRYVLEVGAEEFDRSGDRESNVEAKDMNIGLLAIVV